MCKCVCMCTSFCNYTKHLPLLWCCLPKMMMTDSYSLSLSLPPSPFLRKYTPLTPVSVPSCQCSIMVLHELSVRQPLTTKGELERIGRREAGLNDAALFPAIPQSLHTLLYLMPSGSRNDFLSC